MAQRTEHILSHLVPRCYLKRFANSRDQIRVHRKDDLGNSFVANISKVGAERDFYAVETKGGLSQDVETRLAELDGKACAALARINPASWPPSQQDREILANFIAVQITRGWPFREMMTDAVDAMMKLAGRAQAAHPEGIRNILGGDVTPEQVEEVAATLRAGEFTVTPNRSATVIDSMRIAAELVQPIASLKWDLLVAQMPAILTSDAPISLWRRRYGSDDHWGVGVLTADEITLPIDPQRCLLLHRPDHESEFWSVPEYQAILTLNMRTALGAHRYFFGRPPIGNGGR